MYQKYTLDNGLRLTISPMPHCHSVCLSLFVGTGSRYEKDEEAGISHFLEHLFFKGSEQRPTAKDISEAIEGVGGMLNAGTERELTVFWCKIASAHFPLAMDILVDMLRHPRFDPEDIEKERQVILEELRAIADSPQQKVEVLIDEVLWPNQALGRDVAGSKETVQAITRPMILEYLNLQYRPGNTVVSVAGNVSPEEVLASFQKALGDWEPGPPQPWFPANDSQAAPRMRLERRHTEQAHLSLALPGLSYFHPDRFTLGLLNVILGDGMSSRLFVEIREKQGLAYDIHSYLSHFFDAGAMTIYAGVEPKKARAALDAILQELRRLREDIPQAELTKAKELTKGRLLLRMEDNRSVSGWLGAQELLTGHIRTVDEVVEIIDRVTVEDLQRVARQLLVTEKLNLAIVGPFRRESPFRGRLQI